MDEIELIFKLPKKSYTETVNSTTTEPIQKRNNYWCIEKIRCSEWMPDIKEVVHSEVKSLREFVINCLRYNMRVFIHSLRTLSVCGLEVKGSARVDWRFTSFVEIVVSHIFTHIPSNSFMCNLIKIFTFLKSIFSHFPKIFFKNLIILI
jgi:hypothetical protein